MLWALLGETCRLTSAFSDWQPCLAHKGRRKQMKGWRWEVGGSEGSSGLVVNTFGEMTMAFPASEWKRERQRMDLMCQWSLQRVVDSVDLGFDYCLYRLLSVSLLSATADCAICINESRKREMVIAFTMSFSCPISQSSFKTFQLSVSHFSLIFLQHSFLPPTPLCLLSLFLFPLFRFLWLSSRQTRIQPTRLLFIAKQQQPSHPPPPPHTHTSSPPWASSCL